MVVTYKKSWKRAQWLWLHNDYQSYGASSHGDESPEVHAVVLQFKTPSIGNDVLHSNPKYCLKLFKTHSVCGMQWWADLSTVHSSYSNSRFVSLCSGMWVGVSPNANEFKDLMEGFSSPHHRTQQKQTSTRLSVQCKSLPFCLVDCWSSNFEKAS